MMLFDLPVNQSETEAGEIEHNLAMSLFFKPESLNAKVKRSANVVFSFISNVHELQTFDYPSDDADLNIRIKADFNVLICFIR